MDDLLRGKSRRKILFSAGQPSQSPMNVLSSKIELDLFVENADEEDVVVSIMPDMAPATVETVVRFADPLEHDSVYRKLSQDAADKVHSACNHTPRYVFVHV